MSRYIKSTAMPTTPDDTFCCTDDIVAELKRLHRPQMAAWVARQGHENAEKWQRERQLMQEIHELRERLGLNVRENVHDPRPPAEASD